MLAKECCDRSSKSCMISVLNVRCSCSLVAVNKLFQVGIGWSENSDRLFFKSNEIRIKIESKTISLTIAKGSKSFYDSTKLQDYCMLLL